MANQSLDQAYADLEIRIFQREGPGYPVEITLAGQQEFPRGYLTGDVVPWTAHTSGVPANDGQRLFEILLADSPLRQAWAQAHGRAPQRRLRLRIDPGAPELHALPWELLHDGKTMLAASPHTPFSRYLPVSEPWGQTLQETPLRLLVVIANPEDLEDFYNLPPLDVDLERSVLHAALSPLSQDKIVLDFLKAPATLERLERALSSGYPVLHLVGHGAFSAKRGQAALYLQDENGYTRRVLDEQLVDLLARQAAPPRLVSLVACQSATRSTADAFLGLGPKLVAAGVPAVVAMQAAVTVETARRFSATFYQRLLEHGQVDLAANQARGALLTAERVDVAVPVLFMRLRSGQLWERETEEADSPPQTVRLAIPPPPQPTPPPGVMGFVGRQAELSYLADKLTSSGLVVITGMPGIGKTSLAAVLARQAAETKQVFWHTFHDGDRIQVIIWKLAGFLFWHGQKDLWNMLQSGSQSAPPEVLLDYALQMLQGQKFLLCFDDFDFVDDDPDDDARLAQLIERLRQATTAGELRLIVVSQQPPSFARAEELHTLAGLNLPETFQFLAQHDLAPPEGQIAKPMLHSTATLLRAPDLMTADVVANLHARTEGNPQFLNLAVDALKRTSAPALFIARLFVMDDMERFLIKNFDDNLTQEERTVMCAVALLMGYPATRDAIEAILDGQNVRRILSELSQRHLLSTTERHLDREYKMNAVVRHFYYDLLSKGERQAMHRRAGLYYESEELDFVQAARHLECAGEAARAAQLATAHVQTMINRGEAPMLQSLLRDLAAEQLPPDLQAKVNLALGQIQALLGEGQAALSSYQQALASLADLPASRPTQTLKTSVHRWLAELYERQGQYTLALEQVQQGLAALTDQETVCSAELNLIAAQVHIRLGEYDQALTQAEHSLHLGQKLNQATVQTRAHNVLGLISNRRGNNAAAIEHYQHSLAAYQQVGDLVGSAKTYNLIGSAHFETGQWSQAETHFRQARDIFGRLGDALYCAGLDNNLGFIALNQGRLDEALACYRSGLALLEQAGGSLYLQSIFQASLGHALIRLGDLNAARQHLQISLDYAQQISARDFLPELHRLRAEAALQADELVEAQAQAQQSLALARELAMRGDQGRSLRVLGEIALSQGQLDQAQAYLTESCSILEEVNDAYEKARSQLSLARLYAAQQKPQAALNALQECQPIFEKLGAGLDLAAARALQEAVDATL